MTLSEDEVVLIENAKEYLTAFLANYGEFHPFAMIMDKNKNIYPLEHDIEEDYPKAESLINLYEQYFKNELNGENILGILCTNVLIGSKSANEPKRDAIEIRLICENYRKKVFQYYELKEQQVLYQELIGMAS